jgi:tRNA threonylcarbamoyladenosine biosynthesis protein TsaE
VGLRSIPLHTRRDTQRLGRAIGARLSAGDLVVLAGELGTGKTFLARAIARGMGVPPSVRVTSPTFTLVQEYETPVGTLLHADLYRLRGTTPDEATRRDVERLGLRERRSEGSILVVEWGLDAIPWLGGDPEIVVELQLNKKHRNAKLSGRKSVGLA